MMESINLGISRRSYLIALGFLVFFGCKSNAVESAENRYRHSLYSSEQECRRLNPNPEVSCYQVVNFGQNGEVNIMLGNDVYVKSTYIQKQDTITINATSGLPEPVVFYVFSKAELVNVSNGTKWQHY